MSRRHKILLVLALIVLAPLLYLALRQPASDAAWIPEQARTAYAEVGEVVTLHNVRDWTYDATGPITTDWISVTIDPDTITRAWFLLEPFSDWKAVGHTFLSFELIDGSVYSFSVEARRESDETYSALKGLFRTYELSYQWGTERDFVTRRMLYLDHPLRLYPLELSPEAARALFLSLIKETDELAENPRFYNTLTANCTNVLAHIVNRHYPNTLPYDLSWNLTGLSDVYLMEEGLIPTKGSIEETQALYDLTPHKETIHTFSTSTPSVFSTSLRSLLPK